MAAYEKPQKMKKRAKVNRRENKIKFINLYLNDGKF